MRLTRDGQRFAKFLRQVDDKEALEPFELAILDFARKDRREPGLATLAQTLGISDLEVAEIIEKLDRFGLAKME